MAWNLARDRFIGGGFEIATPLLFAKYAPNPLGIHAAHSIYFQVLGEHGFIGLALFLLLWFATWRMANRVRREVTGLPELEWAGKLVSMVQVGLVGYFVGGAFLSLAYFDLPYDMMVMVLIARRIVDTELAAVREKAIITTPSMRPSIGPAD
jgi:probable O-glycosylation ligase (exosortase A-associated)